MSQAVQCPRCQGAVTVADESAGQRVQCPLCQQEFLAPGVAATDNHDDDWLKLDSTTPSGQGAMGVTAAGGSGSGNSGGSNTGKSGGRLSEKERALLADFTDDLDEFTLKSESLPPVAPFSGSTTPAAAMGGGAMSKSDSAGQSSQARPVEFAEAFRVKCNVCGSPHDVKASQAGKTIKCSDCHSAIVVPPPPKVRQKSTINLDQAETYGFQSNENVARTPDPYQKSARDLLDEASREEKPKLPKKYDDVPDAKEWFESVFGILRDPGVMVHWVGLSVLAAIPAYVALSSDMDILKMGLFPVGIFLGVMVISCGFAILQSIANQQDRVADWPVLDPFNWIGQLIYAFAAAFVAGGPVWMICGYLFGASLLSVAITMFFVFVLYPFVLLSMLDMETPFAPFSSEVARSVTKCEEAWGGFYFSSALLFVALFLLYASIGILTPPTAAVITIISTIGIAFVYFAMIGRLAFAIGQAVNAPPMVNDINRQRHTD